MTGYFCSVLELMIFLPGMLLAYLPMKQYLRMRPAKLAAVTVPLTLFLCLAGSAADCFFHIGIIWMFFLIAAIMGSFHVHTLKITRWKSVSVFLAVCGAFSCLGSASLAVNGLLIPGAPTPPLSFRGALFWFVLCCVSVLAVWYPATHAARGLLEDDSFAQTWYIFWILPVLFIGINLAMIPQNPDMLEQGRLRKLYILFSFVLLILLLLSYFLSWYYCLWKILLTERSGRKTACCSPPNVRAKASACRPCSIPRKRTAVTAGSIMKKGFCVNVILLGEG